MPKPFLLVQLSDPHLGAEWGGEDPERRLAEAVAAVGRLRPAPDAVLVTGDLTNDATDASYERARELLAPLAAPLHVLPGNHDDRDGIRRHFGIPGADGGPVQYSVDLGPLRLVVIDTLRPGEDSGELDTERLAWLDAELSEAPDRITLVAMHHPPLSTGIPSMDVFRLPDSDRRALGEVIARQPQVRRIAAGHMHRTIASELAGCTVLAVPSTYMQARLDFHADELSLVAEPPGYAVHALIGEELVSHVQPVT